jgi:hypothetical protein
MNLGEFQLLLYCARLEPDARAIRDLVNEGTNWQTLLEFAQQHSVRPTSPRSLKSVCWDAVLQRPNVNVSIEQFLKNSVSALFRLT